MKKQQKKYRVEVTRAGRWWAIEFPDDDRIHSQARRLDQVPGMAADALSLSYGREVTPEQVEIATVHLDDRESPKEHLSLMLIRRALDEYLQARQVADEATSRASIAMRRVAGESVKHGLPVRDVGHLLGVSYQRAAVLAKEARRLGDCESRG